MSSLAAARADNFYHPPDWDPRKKSRAEHANGPSAEKWKSHPLRERAKKLDQGILTIRFEMPFNVRCTGCGNHIAKGVRYNAEKKTIGKYHSTKILSFRMLCHCEDGTSRTDQRRNPHWIEIHTDPKNAEYVVADGAVRVSDPSLLTPAELGVEATLDEEEAGKRAADPFYRLEHGGGGAAGGRKKKPWLEQLQDQRDDNWHNDYDANRLLRKQHRTKRDAALMRQADAAAKGVRVPLPGQNGDDVEEDDPADVAAARAAEPGASAKRRKSFVAVDAKRLRLMNGSIFGGAAASGGRSSRSSARSDKQAVEESERLRLLQMRRERGMRITTATAATATAPVAAAEIVVQQAPAIIAEAPRRGGLVAYSDSEED
jgi:coiled-coil domain-containing protein 130